MKSSYLVLVLSALNLAACATVTFDDASVRVPAQWSLERAHDRITLHDPERQLRVTIFAASHAATPSDAIAAAWQHVDPAFALAPTEPPDSPPPSGGWDAITTIHYATPVDAARDVRAVWRRLDTRNYVVLIDGDRNALERRNAQVQSVVGSLRPRGLHDELLVGKPRALVSAELDEFIARAQAALGVPGAAVGVIVDGKVVYSRAFGVRTIGETAPITIDTRFLLASITKPMTTFMQAALVDAGVVRWDSPVTSLLPTFALGDDAMTRSLRLWQMSCACTGMPRQDLEGMFEWEHVTPEARIGLMRTMKPTTKLGETFQYSNPMVAAGGYAAAHAFAPTRSLAEAYAAAMQAKVFAPLGMTATTLDFATVQRGEHATPHALAIDGTTHAMPLAIERAVEPIAPAGGVWTTLADMQRYVQTELANGVAPNGKRVVSAANLRERRKLRVASDEAGGYGLGLDVGTYSGQREVGHDGGAFGFGTTMFMLPDVDRGIGIVILTNIRNGNRKEQLPFNAAVTRRIVELLFVGARSRAADELAYYVSLRQAIVPHVISTDRAWVAPLVGEYHHPSLGTVTIRQTATGAELDAGEWRTAIDRVVDAEGRAQLVFLEPPFAGGVILVDSKQAPATLIIPGQTTYTFRR